MAIDIAPYEAPIKEAEQKLKGDTGAATRAQADLADLSAKLTGYSTQHAGDAGRLQGNWIGDRGDTFGVRAKEHTEALEEAAGWASKTAQTIGDATTLIQQAEQEVANLLREFDADARTLADAAAASKDPGAEQQARAVIAGMSARYAKEAADIVNAAKNRLNQLVSNLGETKPAETHSGPIGSRSSGGGNGGGGGTHASSGPPMTFPPSDQYGSGTQIKLPGGQTVNAPTNAPRSPCGPRSAASACPMSGVAPTPTAAWTAAASPSGPTVRPASRSPAPRPRRPSARRSTSARSSRATW